ncbi:MAG: recombination regulator RecX [Lentisphaerae bacterium ADurb.BinA184]|nr:MAG: recombination regulator RecX [Lentisphaerae bacterium ADurb.BinA184]
MPLRRANPDAGSADACRERALRLLEQRPHAVAELRRKLLQRGFLRGVVESVLADLERLGLLDDAAVARDACAAALQRPAALGRGRILANLRRHGIAADVAQSALREAGADADAPDELERALAAAQTKLRLLTRETDPRRRRDKLARFLLARGFAPGIAREAVDRLAAGDPDDPPPEPPLSGAEDGGGDDARG